MDPEGKKLVALFLVISLLTINCSTIKTLERKRKTAKRKHGSLLLITKKDEQQITGELVAAKVKQKSLLLLDSESKVDVSVDIKDIKVITIKKKSMAVELAYLAGLGFAGVFVIWELAPGSVR